VLTDVREHIDGIVGSSEAIVRETVHDEEDEIDRPAQAEVSCDAAHAE